VDINPAFTRLTGYRLDEVLGKNPSFLHSGKQGDAFYAAMWAQIGSKGRWQGEVWNRRKNGDIYAEWLTVNTLYHDDGSVHRRVGLFSDITERKRSEELIWTQANFDALTGMPNRRMFLDRLAQDLKKAHRGGFKLALLFLDLDHFKEINDTLGHDVGDVLLTEAARRIAACTRESDTVARIGGDEFTVILAELTDTSGVDRIANDILNALAQPFLLGTEQAYVSVSIGITVYPDDALNQENLLKNADQAMYVSKDEGRNRFSYFTRAMQDAARHRQHLLSDLRTALSNQQFELHYQPIVDLRSGHIRKAEALLRWQHPTGRQIGPAEFIPLAEESGLIHAIGCWVFAQATHQVQHWRTSLDPAFQVSVNLSPVQLQSGSERLPWKQLLQSAQLQGEAIVFEITEGLLLDKAPCVTAELLAYRDAGIQVAIDDFGTGYSALAYLTQLDIDYLKIDQSFVRKMAAHANDRALCEAIVVMAHKLGLKVIAEGVETAEQRDLLSAMGCDYAQGFLFAKALPANVFEQWFAAQTTQP
jgi:diguanylate cyclase (GGDEF)-like protein/PAS domain S-box-containing protein